MCRLVSQVPISRFLLHAHQKLPGGSPRFLLHAHQKLLGGSPRFMLHTWRATSKFQGPCLLYTRRCKLVRPCHFGCNGPTSTTSSAATTHLPVALTLLHLNAPLLDFLLVGCTGSDHAPGHCISRRDYSSSGLHRLYCAYVVHPDVPSRRSTSCWSVALALAMRPVTPSRGTTTHRPVAPALLHLCRASGRAISPLDFSSVGCTSSHRAPGHCFSRRDYSSSGCTGSTAPVPCIRTHRLTARLLVGRSH
jgi:hypothetical protein